MGIGFAAVAVAFSAASAHADLLGYWKLNETAGDVASDSSGNDRHGTLRGALTDPPDPGPAWVPGVFDGAISLDGLNDRIHVPHHQSFEYAGGDLALSTWIYLDADERTGRIISRPWNWSGRYNYVLFVEGATNPRVTFSLANSHVSPPEGEPDRRQSVSLSSPYFSSFRESWHHVAAVVDSANNISLYVNGELAGSRTNTITDWEEGFIQTHPLTLGTLYPYGSTWAGVTDHAFHGKMDDTAIFNDALDPAKIMSIYNVPTTLGLPYDLGDMMTLWSIFDTGPGGFGVIDGMPWWYTDDLPGTPPSPGGAYVHDDIMYVVLGPGAGLRVPEPTSFLMALVALVFLTARRPKSGQ